MILIPKLGGEELSYKNQSQLPVTRLSSWSVIPLKKKNGYLLGAVVMLELRWAGFEDHKTKPRIRLYPGTGVTGYYI
jgi:hypothetical protein